VPELEAFKIEMNIILGDMISLSMQRPKFSTSSMLDTLYSIPKQKGKVLLPLHQQTQAMASRILGCPPYQQQFGRVLFHYYILILIFIIGLGIPITSHFLVNDKRMNTHHENNSPSMEDTDRPLSLHE
jgi:hypothetical protein